MYEEHHAYGLSAAFETKVGNGDSCCVNFNAECDALHGIGHACGHSVIAISSITGVLALEFAIRQFSILGHVLGTITQRSSRHALHGFVDEHMHRAIRRHHEHMEDYLEHAFEPNFERPNVNLDDLIEMGIAKEDIDQVCLISSARSAAILISDKQLSTTFSI